ncbi:MAG TPA: protein-disulfide reductase DsbD domain-containing protein [Cyclobacteriaceae bacterium]|nr:protein-disulfide reductase DsbD domain-containing protein [Cyclobacteriaceae bacterium]
MTTLTRLAILFFIVHGVNFSDSQSNKTIEWQYEVNAVGKDELILKFTARMARGWHLYSQHIKEGGPMPTRFSFMPDESYLLLGQISEKGNAVKFYDDTYEMEIIWYTGVVSFAQKVRLTPKTRIAKATIEFMTCNDYTCIPGKQDFNIDLKK